jgi:cytosine/adenosine deaminase-related metal-dependent hydrolase
VSVGGAHGGRSGRLTLRGRYLVPIAGPPLAGGWVRIERGRIAAMGCGRPSEPVIDLGDSIILPGLVNAHTHLEFSDLAAPLAADGGLPDWIRRVVTLRRSHPVGPAADERLATAVAAGLAESAAAGVTSLGEIATATPPAFSAAGPRLRIYREALGLSPEAMAAAEAAVVRDLDCMHRRSAWGGVSPHAPYSVGAVLGRRAMHAAVRRRLPVATHLAESPEELELLSRGRGAFRQLLEDLGAWQPASPPRLLPLADWITLLSRAYRAAVIHATFLPEDGLALARLARHRDRMAVVVCPRTAWLLAGRLPPIAALRFAGVRVALGTDSRATAPDLSLLAECRALVDGGLVSPAEALAMATREAAWAVGLERRAGVIATGRPADLAIIRPAHAAGDPAEEAIGPTAVVTATLRNGRLLHGRL